MFSDGLFFWQDKKMAFPSCIDLIRRTSAVSILKASVLNEKKTNATPQQYCFSASSGSSSEAKSLKSPSFNLRQIS